MTAALLAALSLSGCGGSMTGLTVLTVEADYTKNRLYELLDDFRDN